MDNSYHVLLIFKVAYRMSKSALNSFGKSCSVDLAKYHILVTTFCPGWVKTDMGGANGKLEVRDVKNSNDLLGIY